jgi:predicted membrane protein
MGDGIGFVTKTISDIVGMNYNFHSDILKNFLEFGPVVFCLWVYFLYKINARNLKTLLYVIYTNVLFITDNVFIYFDVFFLFYFFITITLIEERDEYEVLETEESKELSVEGKIYY